MKIDKRKIGPWLGYVALLLTAVSVFVVLFWIYSPPMKALEISPNPIPVVTDNLKPYDYAVLKYTYCKNVTTTGRLTITLVGTSSQLVLPTTHERGERKCQNDVRVPLAIPPLTPPGEYHFHFRVMYIVNPLRTITQDFDTQEFKVIK